MKCCGCDAEIDQPAAYAIMHRRDMADAGITPEITGGGQFDAAPVCNECFVNPEHRTRPLKAHFGYPDGVHLMVGAAGSSTGIGG